MRRPGSGSLRVAVFSLLALGSLGLKAAAGAPRDEVAARPGEFERIATARLQNEHFTINLHSFRYRSTLLLAARGSCRIAIRDATDSNDLAALFAQDVQMIGPIRYLYRGKEYERPPQLAFRIQRLAMEAIQRLGLKQPRTAVPVAFAASPECGGSAYGFRDVRLDS